MSIGGWHKTNQAFISQEISSRCLREPNCVHSRFGAIIPLNINILTCSKEFGQIYIATICVFKQNVKYLIARGCCFAFRIFAYKLNLCDNNVACGGCYSNAGHGHRR